VLELLLAHVQQQTPKVELLPHIVRSTVTHN
jgi:hypothetical protein